MDSDRPKISICIPTFNRAPYLRLLLRDLFEDPPQKSFEVVICDNDSTDETGEVIAEWEARTSQVRGFRQRSNLGPYANITSVYRLSRGEYAVYLADDDRIVSPAVDEGVEFLDRHAGVAAYYASHEFWDARTKTSHGVSYPIAEEKFFSKLDAMALVNYVVQPANLPEIGIYRTSALFKIATPPIKASMSLTNIADILDFGDICFRTVPFYRYLIQHEIDNPPGHSVGQRGVLNELDAYRAGLQYLAARAYRYIGYDHVPEGDHAVLNAMIEACLDSSLVNATNVLIGWQEYRGAYEFLMRQMVRGWFPASQLDYFRSNLVPGSVAQAAIEMFEAISIVDRFALFASPDRAAMLDLFAKIRPGLAVEANDAELLANGDRTKVFVLAGDEEARLRLIGAGFESGLIVSQVDLTLKYQI